MKKALLFIVMLLFPVIAFAATTEIESSDFTGSGNLSKGISIRNEGGFTLESRDYILTEDISLGHQYLWLEDANVTIYLNGHTLSGTNEINNVINMKNGNLTIIGNGAINNNSNYEDYAVWLYGNSNVTIENCTINGINSESRSDNVYGTANLKNVILTEPSGLRMFNEVIIDNVIVDVNSGGIEVNNANLVTIDYIEMTNGTGFFGLSNDDNVVINNANINGTVGIYMEAPVKHLIINGGTFKGQMYSLMLPIDDLSNPNVELKGGTFSVADPASAFGNIIIVCNGECNEEDVYSILSSGYKFSDDLDIESMDLGGATGLIIKNNTSVIPVPAEPEEVVPETKEEPKKEDKKNDENPKTVDNIGIYVLTTCISAIGILKSKKH